MPCYLICAWFNYNLISSQPFNHGNLYFIILLFYQSCFIKNYHNYYYLSQLQDAENSSMRHRRMKPPFKSVSPIYPPKFLKEPSNVSSDVTETNNDLVFTKRRSTRVYSSSLTLEIALFLDAVLLNNLYSFYSEDQLIDLILSLMNNVSYKYII